MSRSNYWSLSRFSKWLRTKFGLENPGALSSEDWVKWRKDSKLKAPFIHWLTDTAFDRVQDFFCWPKDKLWDLRCALNSRFFDKYYTMQTRLDPWRYHEVDTRMLHGMFETLVDFVEIEKAWVMVIWGQDENRKKFGYKWYEMNGWTSWFASEKRHPEAGLAHLEWEMSLVRDNSWYGDNEEAIAEAKEKGEYGTMTHQAEAAKEQFELYNWWKNVRPKRPDPMDASGYTVYFDRLRNNSDDDFFSFLNTKSEEDRIEQKTCSDLCSQIEEAYEKEDEEMLIRLIKIRRSLWT